MNRSINNSEAKFIYESNLNKYDTDKWLFYTNKTGLTAGTYTYQAFAKDGADKLESNRFKNIN